VRPSGWRSIFAGVAGTAGVGGAARRVRAERQRDAARIAGFVAEVNCMRKVYAPGLFAYQFFGTAEAVPLSKTEFFSTL